MNTSDKKATKQNYIKYFVSFCVLAVVLLPILFLNLADDSSAKRSLEKTIGLVNELEYSEIILAESPSSVYITSENETQHGVIRNETELSEFWANLYVKANLPTQRFEGVGQGEAELKPTVNFEEYMIIWIQDDFGGSSFAGLKEIVETKNVIEVWVTPVSTDYISEKISLYLVKKSDKQVEFKLNQRQTWCEYEETGQDPCPMG